MTATCNQTWRSDPDVWILSLRYFPELYGGCVAASNTAGGLSLYNPNNTTGPICTATCHSSSVNAMAKNGENNLVTAASDGVKLWDLRNRLDKPVVSFASPDSLNYISVASQGGLPVFAAGAELTGPDATVHLWDLRSPEQILRKLTESHRDDVTAVEFHPKLNYLMSGSTDGTVNVYNLDIAEEEDSYLQSVLFSSVHLCHFLTPERIAILSHIETLGFFQLDNIDCLKDPVEDRELGDVREKFLKCEYVVDLFPNHIVYGSNSLLSLTLMDFDPVAESFDTNSKISFPQAHGEEVVRDFCKVPDRKAAFTGGEDGLIKCWSWGEAGGEEKVSLKRLVSSKSKTSASKKAKVNASGKNRSAKKDAKNSK